MYTDAVRLLKEGKYKEALDKWQEVKEIDPKYPDRQNVQRITSNTLGKSNNIVGERRKVLWILGIIGLTGFIVLLAISPIFSGLINPTPTAISEIPIEIHIATSSDWTSVELVSGGQLKDLRKVLSSSQALVAGYFGNKSFFLSQPTEGANGIKTIQMVVAAKLTNIASGTPLVLSISRGCIGKTTVELYHMIAARTLVKKIEWGNTCTDDQNLYIQEVPVELFSEDN